MNHRIRSRGGLIWFTPRMHVTYRPRSSVRSLGRQYLHYGRWRREVMRRHPETAKTVAALRYFAPPVVTLAVIFGLVTGVAGWLLGYPSIGLLFPTLYLLGVVAVSPLVAPRAGLAVLLRVPVVLATMHLAWGWGFLTSPDDLREGELEGSR